MSKTAWQKHSKTPKLIGPVWCAAALLLACFAGGIAEAGEVDVLVEKLV